MVEKTLEQECIEHQLKFYNIDSKFYSIGPTDVKKSILKMNMLRKDNFLFNFYYLFHLYSFFSLLYFDFDYFGFMIKRFTTSAFSDRYENT